MFYLMSKHPLISREDGTAIGSIVDPERFSPDPDPPFQVVPDPEAT
jgi:hypothetical protein